MNDAYMLTVLAAALPESDQNLEPSGQRGLRHTYTVIMIDVFRWN
jgi:hypothetical protein